AAPASRSRRTSRARTPGPVPSRRSSWTRLKPADRQSPVTLAATSDTPTQFVALGLFLGRRHDDGEGAPAQPGFSLNYLIHHVAETIAPCERIGNGSRCWACG